MLSTIVEFAGSVAYVRSETTKKSRPWVNESQQVDTASSYTWLSKTVYLICGYSSRKGKAMEQPWFVGQQSEGMEVGVRVLKLSSSVIWALYSTVGVTYNRQWWVRDE